MNRRRFLEAAGAGAASLASIAPRAFAAANDAPLRVALIGSGWYGKTDLLHLNQMAAIDVVGLCDVDKQMVERAAELVATRQPSKKKPPVFGDYMELLSKLKPEAVLIATPDHWHALTMIEACRQGADVYVQKPICYDVVEGQAMVAAARKYNRTVQVGLQRRSTPHLLEARDRFLQEDKLGKIAYIEIHSYFGGPGKTPPNGEPPAGLDWDAYVGPAPMREFNPAIHPRGWRSFRQFSNGQTGDLCVHFLDAVRFLLGLGWPRRITASGGILMRDKASEADVHDTQTAIFEYPDLQIVWTQRNWGASGDEQYPWGATLYGDRGTLKMGVFGYDFFPHGRGEKVHRDWVNEVDKYPEDGEYKETELFAAPATRRQLKDFVDARREKRPPVAPIEEGYISSACCILANLSMELGRSLDWDHESGHVRNDDEANKRLARPYREPWIHPTPDNV